MTKFLIIFLFLMSCKASQQVTTDPLPITYRPSSLINFYSIQWKATNEAILQKGGYYEVQVAQDTTAFWSAISPKILPGQISYAFVIPTVPNYYRVRVVGLQVFNMPAIKLTIPDKVTITNAAYRTTSLTWMVTNSSNIDYYLLEKTLDGKTYSQVQKVVDRGNANYTYKLARTINKYTYRVTTFFKSGKKSGPIKFV